MGQLVVDLLLLLHKLIERVQLVRQATGAAQIGRSGRRRHSGLLLVRGGRLNAASQLVGQLGRGRRYGAQLFKCRTQSYLVGIERVGLLIDTNQRCGRRLKILADAQLELLQLCLRRHLANVLLLLAAGRCQR
jgi:hypothetical protein